MNVLASLLATLLQAAAPVASPSAVVDPVFQEWSTATPGCAVGVERDGDLVVEQGFGMADLERGIPNRGETIFEAGSVSKQFTAAAVLLLAGEGRLSLDEPIRGYIPELPEAAQAVTIRQMLQHTSGLRDWGSVAGIAGWPRTTRVHTHAHVLDILSRQQALNFPPGDRWSYSNSGYNLAAILVERVSGESLASFSRHRLFEPLGMTRTSWRDDHTRLVPGRALAYRREADGYHLQMPFENAYGNGGLLTTVGDLVRWARHFRAPSSREAAVVTEQTTPGRFADGRPHDYGLGVWVGTYRGWREVRHSGSTAGYRAYLTTFPEHRATVAVLCNAADASAEALTYKTVDAVMADLAPRDEPIATFTLSADQADALVALYRNDRTGVPVRVTREGTGLRVERGAVLHARAARAFVTRSGDRWAFADGGRVTVTDSFGTVTTLSRVAPWTPSAADLAAFAGTYTSTEAEALFTVDVEGAALVLRQRPDREIRLTPLYVDAFEGALGTVQFRRDPSGRVSAFVVSQDRVWALAFDRQVAR